MRDWSENQITLVMIRHGATKSNKEYRYLGRTDEALSKEGLEQLSEYKKQGVFPDIDFLFTSPMKRCIETADILYPGMKSVQIENLIEMDFGVFEGKNYEELQEDKRYQAWIDSNGTLPFPEGESRENFISRCNIGFLEMFQNIKRKKEHTTIGMIVHGGTIMAILSKYGQGNYFDYQVANGKGYICSIKNVDGRIEIVDLEKL